ncbi:hypothetical protein Gpo141_00008593 [Globisporangium polare]
MAASSTAAADLDAYGFVENGVPIARYLRSPNTGWEFALHTRASPPPLFVDVDRFAPFRDTKIPLLLDAVARIQRRSRELDAFPTAKADFWAAIFPSHSRPSDLQLGVEKWMMEAQAFPHIVLSFHQMRITKARLDMLLEFMTVGNTETDSPSQWGHSADHEGSEANLPCPSIGLKFTQCEVFGTDSLKLLLAFLDALFVVDVAGAARKRRFTVRSLSLSNNQMNAEQLVLLTKLLEKNRRVYRIKEIALNDIFFSRERGSDEADRITSLLGVIFNKNQSSSLPGLDSPPESDLLVLKRVSFDHSSLRLQHFAAMCSALRYGCPVEELSLLSTLNRVSAGDRQQCWRWLAFALFYPRSKRHHESSFHLKKIDLSRIELRVADAKAIKSTLADPASELVYNGSREKGQAAEPVSMCRVQKGEFVHESPAVTSTCIATIDHNDYKELEVLVRDDNGWTCVVVPGFGLGWIQASRVDGQLDCDRSSYDPQIDNLYELTIHRLSSKKAPISTLLECVGRHLSLLSLKYNMVDIAAIQKHCVNLKHLDLEGCSFQGSRVTKELVFGGAHRPFFKRLVSLNLNDTEFSDDDVARLGEALLEEHDSPPAAALQELRITSSALTFEGYEGIHTMLMGSKTLVVVELVDPRQHLPSAELFQLFEHSHQGELLAIQGAIRKKAAFLSVLTHDESVTLPPSRSSLDANVVATIFEFAGTPVHRRVMWRASSDGDY